MNDNFPIWFRGILWLTFGLVFTFFAWALTSGAEMILAILIVIIVPKLLISLICIILIWIIYAAKKYFALKYGDYSISKLLSVVFAALALTAVILPAIEFAPFVQQSIEHSQRKKAEYKASHATDGEVRDYLKNSEGEEFEIIRNIGSLIDCRPAAHPEVVFRVEKRNGQLTYKDSYKKAIVERAVQREAMAELSVLDVEHYCSPDLMYDPGIWDDIMLLDKSLYYAENMLDSLYIPGYRIEIFVELRDSYDVQQLYGSMCGMTDIVDGEYLSMELVPVTHDDLEKYRQTDSENTLVVTRYTTTSNRVELHFNDGVPEMDIDEFDERLSQIIEARQEEYAKRS